MLRNVLLISSSGIVLFSKEFIKAVTQPGMIGGLVAAMLDFSTQRVGIPVSYIALSTVGVSIQTNVNARVTCALFHDINDGQDFGKLIATEILNAFISMYSAQLEEKTPNAVDSYSDFHLKITEVIRNSVRPVLESLAEQRGIDLCVLTSGDSVMHATGDIDKLGVLANHQALWGSATDIMASKNDVVSGITLKGLQTTTVLKRLERSSLIVMYSNNVNSGVCDNEISKAARLLGRILNMLSNLQDAFIRS